MRSMKGLAIVALLLGGTSLAMAQSGPATGGQPPIAGGAAGNPANPGPPGPGIIPHDAAGPGLQSAAPPAGAAPAPRLATGPHRNMYMSTRGSRHKPLKTGQPLPKQPQ